MKRRSASKPSPPASKPHRWNICHIKGTPAVLLGHVEAPDEESAIKRAIEEFEISRHYKRGFSRSGGLKRRFPPPGSVIEHTEVLLGAGCQRPDRRIAVNFARLPPARQASMICMPLTVH
jgi:hypothetical protein